MDVLETRGLKKLGYESNSNLFVWNKIHAT